MRGWLVRIFAPTKCILPDDIIWIILELANMARYSNHAAYFYLYACPNPNRWIDRFAKKEKKSVL